MLSLHDEASREQSRQRPSSRADWRSHYHVSDRFGTPRHRAIQERIVSAASDAKNRVDRRVGRALASWAGKTPDMRLSILLFSLFWAGVAHALVEHVPIKSNVNLKP